jgi:hypothetical protein
MPRPIKSTTKLGASAATTLPTISKAIVARNNILVGIERYANAETGIMTAAAKVWVVTTQ